MKLFNFFAPRLHSLNTDFGDIAINLNCCRQVQSLTLACLPKGWHSLIQFRSMSYLQRLVIKDCFYNSEYFFDKLFTEPFPSLKILELMETELKPKPNYQALASVKSLRGVCCKWDDFEKVISLFPQIRQLGISLYTYRKNPRWSSIRPLKLLLNNVVIQFSSEMVTPDDDPPFHLMIDVFLRHIQLNASISRNKNDLCLVDILPQTMHRIENIIDQKVKENFYENNNGDNLETLVETHLACHDISWGIALMSNGGWGFIDTESC